VNNFFLRKNYNKYKKGRSFERPFFIEKLEFFWAGNSNFKNLGSKKKDK